MEKKFMVKTKNYSIVIVGLLLSIKDDQVIIYKSVAPTWEIAAVVPKNALVYETFI
jgi:hypothetical protein